MNLYVFHVSPPSRSAWLTLKLAGVKFEVKIVDLLKQEQLQPWFLKLNPNHTVPTLDDEGFCLGNSHVIMKYVMEKYAPSSPLYPSDPKTRALVNQVLVYEAARIEPDMFKVVTPKLLGRGALAESDYEKFLEGYKKVDEMLEGKSYLAGTDTPTIADIALAFRVTLALLVGLDVSKYANLKAWYEKCKKIEHFDDVNAGFAEFASTVTPKLYVDAVSPPARSAWLVSKMAGLNADIKDVDLAKGGHLSEWFLKLNPNHTVPVLDDKGFVLTNSRAIIRYIAEKYAPSSSLFPSDIKQRAMVNQMLEFEGEVIEKSQVAVALPTLFGVGTATEKQWEVFHAGYKKLDGILEGKSYVAGTEEPTIADVHLAIRVSLAEVVGLEVDKLPNVKAWYERCKSIEHWSEVNKGFENFKAAFAARKGQMEEKKEDLDTKL